MTTSNQLGAIKRRVHWRFCSTLSFSVGMFVGSGSLVHAQTTLPEVQVTKSAIPDFEFDWGRKGVYCPTCNFNTGNSRFVFSDSSAKLWVGQVDFQTGAFYPPDGHGVLVDVDAAKPTDFGNGPEWMLSAAGSQFVYTKYLPGQAPPAGEDAKPEAAGIALATMVNGAWTAGFLPNGMQRASPAGSLDSTDTAPRIHYVASNKANVYWRSMTKPEAEKVMPIEQLTGGNSRRWVEGSRNVIFQGHPPNSPQLLVDQVYLYNTDSTAPPEQLTFDANGKYGAYMWKAPEFNNEYLFFTMASLRKQILVYRKLKGADGVSRWTVIKTINAPSSLPYFWSPELFVHNGRSYIFTEVSASSKFYDLSIPTQLAMTGIDPLRSDFKMLTNDSAKPRVRLDPEYFITAQGPYVYYNRLIPAHNGLDAANDGVWRVDTKLGPPKVKAVAVR